MAKRALLPSPATPFAATSPFFISPSFSYRRLDAPEWLASPAGARQRVSIYAELMGAASTHLLPSFKAAESAGTDFEYLLLSHSPAFGACDTNSAGHHTGSRGIKQFLQDVHRPPLFMVSGHIHEHVAVTGSFVGKVGQVPCYCTGSAGRYPGAEQLAIIDVDTRTPEAAQRHILEVPVPEEVIKAHEKGKAWLFKRTHVS
jgi:hypothetical protein